MSPVVAPVVRKSLFARLASLWFVRSLAMGAISTSCDYGMLLFTSKVLGLRAAYCAMCGLAIGSTISFLLNRYVAFNDCRAPLLSTAVRYAAAVGCLMVVHATAVGLLTDRARWPILLSKLIADVSILAGGQLLLLRYVVFPRNKAAAAPAVAGNRTAEVA